MDSPFTQQTLDQFIASPRPCAEEVTQSITGDVLVLGAAGKMGFHLCLMLKNCFEKNGQANRVIAVSRFSSPGSKSLFEDNGIATIACDLSNETELENLPDASHIWFMAGVKFGTQDDPELLHKMNVEMPGKVAHRFRNSVSPPSRPVASIPLSPSTPVVQRRKRPLAKGPACAFPCQRLPLRASLALCPTPSRNVET